MERSERISFEALLFSIYVALSPANQIFTLGSGSTINKYIGLAVIVVLILKKQVTGEGMSLSNLRNIVPMFLWFGVSVVWSIDRRETVNSIIGLANYALMWFVVSDKEWNSVEKKLICNLSIIFGVYIAFILITGQLEGIRRSTLTLGNADADQNALAVDLSFLFIIALHRMFKTESTFYKFLLIGTCLLFVIGVFSTGSRGALAGLIIGFLYYLLSFSGVYNESKRGIKTAVFFGVGIIIYLILGRDWLINESTLSRYQDENLLFEAGVSGRNEIWGLYFGILNKTVYPYFVGFGYGTTFTAFTRYLWNWPPGTHNTYLYLLVCSGVVGVSVFLWFVWIHLRKCNDNKDLLSKTLIIISMIAMLTLDLFTRKDIWNVFAFAQIGLGYTKLTENSTGTTKEQSYQSRYIK